jgi:hypothetical protein
MELGEQIKVGDVIEAHGCRSLVLEVLPAAGKQKSDRITILSDDNRIWTTRLEYTNWRVINEDR